MFWYRLFCYCIFFSLSTVGFASDLTLGEFKTHKTIILSMQHNSWESHMLEQVLQFPHFPGEKSALTTVHIKREFVNNWDIKNDNAVRNKIKNIIVVDYDEGILSLDPDNLRQFIERFQQMFGEHCLRFVIGISKNSTQRHKNNIMRHFMGFFAENYIIFVEH